MPGMSTSFEEGVRAALPIGLVTLGEATAPHYPGGREALLRDLKSLAEEPGASLRPWAIGGADQMLADLEQRWADPDRLRILADLREAVGKTRRDRAATLAAEVRPMTPQEACWVGDLRQVLRRMPATLFLVEEVGDLEVMDGAAARQICLHSAADRAAARLAVVSELRDKLFSVSG